MADPREINEGQLRLPGWLVPAGSIVALAFAWYFFKQVMKESEGTELMAKVQIKIENVDKP